MIDITALLIDVERAASSDLQRLRCHIDDEMWDDLAVMVSDALDELDGLKAMKYLAASLNRPSKNNRRQSG